MCPDLPGDSLPCSPPDGTNSGPPGGRGGRQEAGHLTGSLLWRAAAGSQVDHEPVITVLISEGDREQAVRLGVRLRPAQVPARPSGPGRALRY
jgi:hypothetical protein